MQLSTTSPSQAMSSSHEFEVFFDGDCPLCAREIAMLQRMDKRGAVLFTDIAHKTFDATQVGVSFATLMARIHGRMPSGELVEGVEVFRQLYGAVGFRRLVALTRWPLVAPALDAFYQVFARHRLRLTGRCDSQGCNLPQATVDGPLQTR